MVAASALGKSLPKLFIGLVVGTLAAALIGSRWDALLYGLDWKSLAIVKHDALKLVGTIPGSLQAPQWPRASWEAWHRAIPAGFTIAILGCLETMLSSVVVDSATNTEHNSNRELVGQGIGNTAAALFGGIAGTGAIVRTMINIRSGGVTRLSGVFCGLVLLAAVLFLGRLAGAIPLAALSGVLMMAAWGMFEWEPLRMMGRVPASDTLVMLTTMLVTVFSDLISAVLIGMVLAAVLFVHRMSRLGMLAEPEHELAKLPEPVRELMRKHRISVCSVEGPLFFGAVKTFSKEITQSSPNILILDMKGVPVIDLSGAQAIGNVVSRMKARGKRVLISGMRQEARKVLHRMGIVQTIGADSFPDDLAKAADYALSLAQDRPPSLADYFKDDLVLLDAEAGSKKELFETVTGLAVDKGYVHDGRAFLENLWKREQDSPTSLGHGVAIPHSRSGAASDEVVVAFVRLRRPIPDYIGIDGKPVELVLMISAGDNVQGYLRVLKLITMAVGREEDRRRLLEAETVGQVLEVFGSVKE
jgi:MFS superfamily sulfate permease-like transporter/mannitol/fructose-specific phosphotransferase system IIA component (Ntr-type)